MNNGRPKPPPPVICKGCGREMSGQDPNYVARKFLAALIGQRVRVSLMGSQEEFVGLLRQFDNYSLVISTPDNESLVLKGPGIVIHRSSELSKAV